MATSQNSGYLNRILSSALGNIIKVFRNGVEVTERDALDFKGSGVSVADNTSTLRTEVTIPGLGDALTSTAPQSVGTANAVGNGTTAARHNHVHAHGAQTDATMHAAATSSANGFLPSADKRWIDLMRAAPGADLSDGDETILIAGGAHRKLPTVTAPRNKTFGTTGAQLGDTITVEVTSADSNDVPFLNGGPGAGTLYTRQEPLPQVAVTVEFDGTNWKLVSADKTDLAYVATSDHNGFMSNSDKSKLDAFPAYSVLLALLVGNGTMLAPSGGDDLAAIQAVLDAGRALILVPDATYLLSASPSVPSGAMILCDPDRPAIFSPTGWAPAVTSANDRTISMLTAASTISVSGTTLSAAVKGRKRFVTVASASGLAADDWIQINGARGGGGDLTGEVGSERYEVVQIDRVGGSTLFLKTPLKNFYQSGAAVKKVTTLVKNVRIIGVRLDASGGSIPVGLRMDATVDCRFDITARGFSHGAVVTQYGCMRPDGKLRHDGECNGGWLLRQTHAARIQVLSTGEGAYYHRNGTIRAGVHFAERCVDCTIHDSFITNFCTGVYFKGTVNLRFENVVVEDTALAERVRRPIIYTLLPNTGTDVFALETAITAGDDWEIQEGDPVMCAAGTPPAPLVAQTVYYARDVTTSGFKLAATLGGAAIDITSTGSGPGGNAFARHLMLADASTDVCTSKAHGLVAGDEIRLAAIGNFPGGLAAGVSYYVIASGLGADTFKLSATQGGSAVNITTAGDGYVCWERCRFYEPETLSRSGLVRTCAAGIEGCDGNPSIGTEQERYFGTVFENVHVNACRVPDVYGNQFSVLLIDAVSFDAKSMSITNRARTDVQTTPASDGHMMGLGMWDCSSFTFGDLRIEGVENGITFLGGWMRGSFDNVYLAGGDGESAAVNGIVNGLESATGGGQNTDIRFGRVEYGYSHLVTAHLNTWFSPTAYSWLHFSFDEIHFAGAEDFMNVYRDVILAKNTTGGTLSYGDVLKVVDSSGVRTVAVPTTDDPEICGVAFYDSSTYANNQYMPVARGSCVATGLTADAVVDGAKLYVNSATMTGSPSDVDFDGTAHTITRNTGSFIADGFRVGQTPTVSGTSSNNTTMPAITVVTATVLTFGSGVTTESNVNAPTIVFTSKALTATAGPSRALGIARSAKGAASAGKVAVQRL